jgi:hypothetical protein
MALGRLGAEILAFKVFKVEGSNWKLTLVLPSLPDVVTSLADGASERWKALPCEQTFLQTCQTLSLPRLTELVNGG